MNEQTVQLGLRERRNMQEVFEKIIEKLANLGWVFADYYPDGTNISRVSKKSVPYDEVVEIVKQTEAEYNNGWIPCSERLPKYGEVVMCCCENGGITVSCITHRCVKLSKIVWFGQHRVIAWQPLHDPYQPKGE